MNNSSLHDKVIWLAGMKSHLKETWIKILKLFYRPKQIFTGVKTAIPEKFGLTLCSCKQIYSKNVINFWNKNLTFCRSVSGFLRVL